MKLYHYRDWIEWPESDVREYAMELAAAAQLTPEQAEYLEKKMAEEAGYWEPYAAPYGPRKIGPASEQLILLEGGDEKTIFERNVRVNTPRREKPSRETIERLSSGSGLTKKFWIETVNPSAFSKRMLKQSKREQARRPLWHMRRHVFHLCDRAYWNSNWYPISYGVWLPSGEQTEPHVGLVWYAENLQQAFDNAIKQSHIGAVQAAMWHSLSVGRLMAELEIRLMHGELYDKSLATRDAMLEGAKAGASARRIASDEERVEAVLKKRQANPSLSATRAIQLVADKSPELGSKDTITRAWKAYRKLGQP